MHCFAAAKLGATFSFLWGEASSVSDPNQIRERDTERERERERQNKKRGQDTGEKNKFQIPMETAGRACRIPFLRHS